MTFPCVCVCVCVCVHTTFTPPPPFLLPLPLSHWWPFCSSQVVPLLLSCLFFFHYIYHVGLFWSFYVFISVTRTLTPLGSNDCAVDQMLLTEPTQHKILCHQIYTALPLAHWQWCFRQTMTTYVLCNGKMGNKMLGTSQPLAFILNMPFPKLFGERNKELSKTNILKSYIFLSLFNYSTSRKSFYS
jgi:hypothetical protein